MNTSNLTEHDPKQLSTQSLTWEDKKRYCEKWKASGESKSQFCKNQGLALATFYGWCIKLWPPSKNKNFSPVKILNKKIPTEQPIQYEHTTIEVTLANQTSIRFKLPIHTLTGFIQELSYATHIIR